MDHEDQFVTDRAHWSVLVPELAVRDLVQSVAFYIDVLGFSIRFKRPENGFAYIELGHAQIMLDQIPADPNGAWITGPMERPFGRGMNLQIEVPNVGEIHDSVVASGIELFRPLQKSWYREEDVENGQAEFLVQDPDGYLLRFMQHLGQRSAGI